MSNISARLVSDPDVGVTLNSQVFAAGVTLGVTAEFTWLQIQTFLNDHLTENQAGTLTIDEEADINGVAPSLEAEYDGLTVNGKTLWLWKLLHLTQQLQDGRITEATWDSKMGL